MQQNRYAT
ncbi:hypothetical protein HaLaN_14565, partial [Haematococcus lacustris]